MRWTKAIGLIALFASSAAPPTSAQAPRPSGTPTPPPTVPGYAATVEIQALAPALKPPPGAAETRALLTEAKDGTRVEARVYLAEDLSRVEILSPDFILPAGAFLLHQAGQRFYAIADPRDKTYFVMDSGVLLDALEGAAGIVNTRYLASVRHADEKKRAIAGYECRKSVVTVTYASSVPFENDRILVKGTNDLEVWHTGELVSSAALDHLFFKFQRDKTGEVRKVLAPQIGFPMEVRFVVSHGEGVRQAVQPGSFEMKVRELMKEKDLDSELFRIPPAGYRQTGKSPLKGAAAGDAP